MFKNKTVSMLTALGLGFLCCMVILCFVAAREAKAVSNEVLRFHIVANSDSAQDQSLKLMVRDGIANLTDKLFKDARDKADAITIANQNKEQIRACAEEILRGQGCRDDVQVQIKNLYFPTKSYENVTFPAGNYDAIEITLGTAQGQNFWCVMFPALCVGAVDADNEALLSEVLEKSELEMVTHPYTLKFKMAEWVGKLVNLFRK